MKKVIKKSGKKQPFSSQKLKRAVGMAVQQSHLPRKVQETIIKKTVHHVLQELEYVDEATTAHIRDLVLWQLNTMDPAVVQAWLAYEIKKLNKRPKKK